jgi:uncharacterized membrane protein YeaQ/YmgE (transglycosylase-associated protein family)
LTAGFLAAVIMRGDGYGWFGNTSRGLLGALVAGVVSSSLLSIDVTGANFTSIAVSVVGACILIGSSRLVGPGCAVESGSRGTPWRPRGHSDRG